MQVRAGQLLSILVTLGCTIGHPVADDPARAGQHAQAVTQTIRTLTDTTDRLESLSDSIETEVNTNRETVDENISTEAVRVAEEVVPDESETESESYEQNPDHQFSISDQVNSFADFSLHPSAVIFTVSNFTTNNPLDNLKDFSNWNASDIHDFQLNHENDIEGNEFSYIDQLAVESEHRDSTVAHAILANDTHESGTYNVTLSTDTTYSEEVTRVWVTTTLDPSTPLYVEEEMEEEMSSTPKYFNTGVNPSRVPELANIQESQLHVTHDQPHDHPLPAHHDTTPHTHTPGVLDVEEVHNQGADKVEEYNFDDHFDLVTVDNDDKSDHADLDRDSSYAVSDNEPVQSTALYNSDLYEVVTSQINPESEIFVDSQEEFSVYEYEDDKSDISDVVIDSNTSQDESGDINEKYASFLDNLKNKYEVTSKAEDRNREHSPKLFEDSLAVLVNTKDSSPKLFDRGLPTHHREDSLESSPPDGGAVVGNSPMTEMGHPLVSLMKIEPHAMKLLVKPRKFEPDTMVRLMYERVPRDKPALQQHLDDPVIEYVHVYRVEQEHYLTNLPMGKYIVCGEAQINGEVFQSNCFETSINRLDNNMLQGGVIAVIAVALLIVFCVILYAIYHRVVVSKKKDMERILQEKVAKFAKKEKEIYEKELYEVPVFAVTYPDPTEPYEERCIM